MEILNNYYINKAELLRRINSNIDRLNNNYDFRQDLIKKLGQKSKVKNIMY